MKILVPFDFSQESINALKLGKEMSTKLKLDLKVIHSLGISDYPYYKTEEADRLKEIVLTNAKSEMRKILKGFFIDPNAIELEIADSKASPHIIRTSREREIIFTVLGRKDQHIPDRIGSTTRDIIRYANNSVISISKELQFDTLKDILFVTDFEPTPVNALSTVKMIQRANNATLKLLYVNTRENWQSTSETKNRMEEFCKLHGLANADLEIINDDSLEKGVLNHIKSAPVDLIAIRINSSYGKLDIMDTHLSAERIMDHSETPILTYSKDRYLG
ncbi:hypothetical protein FGF1_36530 [Flavobacteriaceae bacterium GF1]